VDIKVSLNTVYTYIFSTKKKKVKKKLKKTMKMPLRKKQNFTTETSIYKGDHWKKCISAGIQIRNPSGTSHTPSQKLQTSMLPSTWKLHFCPNI